MPLDRLPGCREHCVADHLSNGSVGLTERCRSLRPGRHLLDLDRRNSCRGGAIFLKEGGGKFIGNGSRYAT
jgi:hypothetical protein